MTAIPTPAEVTVAFRASLRDQRPPQDDLLELLVRLHDNNLEQWRCEDLTRSAGAEDSVVAAAKREIDRLNSTRHELVEAIDSAFADAMDQDAAATPTTESPAMVYDRLSVLVIRLHFTEEAARHDEESVIGARLPVLEQQVVLLQQALDGLLDDIREGRRRFVPYQSLKLYGPPPRGPTPPPTHTSDTHRG